MPALQIKDCPTEVYERLRKCAREENRSISQQALTAIEDFLDLREELKMLGDVRVRMLKPSWVREKEEPDYLTRRREVFARIDKLKPIPIAETLPNSVELLAEAREEADRW